MKFAHFILAILLGLCSAARGAGVAGNVYLLGVALDQAGAPGGWAQIGPAGEWKQTIAGVVLKDQLYTVESGGGLFATNLDTGQWVQIGQAEFGETRLMFAAGDQLYTIENSGSLYRVNPSDGTWAQVGPAGEWGATKTGTILQGQLYTVETGGGLYATNLNTGEWKQIGQAEFATTRYMWAAGNQLYTIEDSGSLYRVNPINGTWAQIGPAGAWGQTTTLAILNGQLYTTETNGGLYRTNLRNGEWSQIGKSEFGTTAYMFASAGFIRTIEADGSLYRVIIKSNMGDFDWCPQEIEKVFREQGNSFYHSLQVRQVLGAQATRSGILSGLAWLEQKTTRNDRVVMYIGAHGGTDPKEGWGIWTADGQMLWGHEIKTELAKLPCQALVMVETCTSGGFAQPHADDSPVPANVTALCACLANQETNNQLDLAVAEGLYGRADFNHDGVVDVDELTRYIKLRYAEWWPGAAASDDSETPVIVQSKGLPGSTPLTKVSKALSAVGVGDNLWSALLEGQTGGQYQVHLLGWSSTPGGSYFVTNSVSRDAICLPGDGLPLLVEQSDQWLPARLMSQAGENFAIHYLGRNQDETVPADRIKYPFAEKTK